MPLAVSPLLSHRVRSFLFYRQTTGSRKYRALFDPHDHAQYCLDETGKYFSCNERSDALRAGGGGGSGTAGGWRRGNGEVRADSGGTIFAGVSYDACPGGSLLPATPISIVGARSRDEYRLRTIRRP